VSFTFAFECYMVDEDPFRPHHRERDNFKPIGSYSTVNVGRRGNKYLVVIKPELEESFLAEMKRLGLPSELPSSATELRTLLNIPNSPKHDTFRMELGEIYSEGKARKVPTFMSEIERVLALAGAKTSPQ
jgi:hypothetical protein